MSFTITSGVTNLTLSFAPAWLLLCGTVTMAGIPLTAGWLGYRRNRHGLAAVALLAGFLSTGLFLYGALNRQSMSRRAVYGPTEAGLDPDGLIPVLRAMGAEPPAAIRP